MERTVREHLLTHAELTRSVMDHLSGQIAQVAKSLINCLSSGGTVYFCGNGGSAADAQHLAAELTGRYLRPNRKGLPAVALTTDTSALTAIGNDFGFDQIFARQLSALATEKDILVGLSTSGNSPNIVAAFKIAKSLHVPTILLSGASGGALKDLADMAVLVPHPKTPHIQEMHITIGHILCELIDAHFGSETA